MDRYYVISRKWDRRLDRALAVVLMLAFVGLPVVALWPR